MTKLVKDYLKILYEFESSQNTALMPKLDQLWNSMTKYEQEQTNEVVDEYIASKDALTDLQGINSK